MEEVFSWVFPAGEPAANRQTGALVSDTALTITITIPSKEWWVFNAAHAKNGDDVSRTVDVSVTDANDNVIAFIGRASIGANDRAAFPNTVTNMKNLASGMPLLLLGGWKIKCLFASGGASSGGTAEFTAVVRKLRL